MAKHYNRTEMTNRRRALRNHATPAEQKLWQKLKGKQIAGIKFRRQFSIDKFVVAFYAPLVNLQSKLMGSTHFSDEAIEYDKQREKHINDFGIQILRFTNVDVFENIDGVLLKIEEVALLRS